MSGFDFHGLTASFDGERVIGPLSFRINEGEHVGLVGKSGAGKSTLIRLLYDRLEGKASLVPQGLGLGLTIAQDLVVAHNGRLEVQSQPKEGSQFAVWLPLRTDTTD